MQPQGRIIALGNTKGGVGKTTLSVQIAFGLALRGHSVWFVDGDKQASAIDAMTARERAGLTPISAAHYPNGPSLRTQAKWQAPKYDFTIIDAGGNDNGALRAAISLCDELIVPFKPRGFDTWALPPLDELVQDAFAARDFEVYALVNEADASGSDNDEALAYVCNSFAYYRPLAVTIGSRKVIATASTTGRYIGELTPRNLQQRTSLAEIERLVDMIERRDYALRTDLPQDNEVQ